MSGISSKGWCEEHCRIDDVTVTSASGSNIGFPQHKAGGVFQPALLNGLRMSGLWLGGAMRRDSYGIYLTHHANNVSIDSFTIDMGVRKSALASGIEWPAVGIHAKGSNLRISNGHFEGMGCGVLVPVSNGINTVTLSNLDGNNMMDKGQETFEEGTPLTPPPSDAPEGVHGTLVWIPSNNHKDFVTVSGLVSHGCKWLLMDDRCKHRVSAFGSGQWPDYPYGRVAFYARSHTWDRGGARISTIGPVQ